MADTGPTTTDRSLGTGRRRLRRASGVSSAAGAFTLLSRVSGLRHTAQRLFSVCFGAFSAHAGAWGGEHVALVDLVAFGPLLAKTRTSLPHQRLAKRLSTQTTSWSAMPRLSQRGATSRRVSTPASKGLNSRKGQANQIDRAFTAPEGSWSPLTFGELPGRCRGGGVTGGSGPCYCKGHGTPVFENGFAR